MADYSWYFLLLTCLLCGTLIFGFWMLIWYVKKAVDEISKLSEVIHNHASELTQVVAKQATVRKDLNDLIQREKAGGDIEEAARTEARAPVTIARIAAHEAGVIKPTQVETTIPSQVYAMANNEVHSPIPVNIVESNDDAESLLIQLFNENKWDDFLLKVKKNGFPVHLAELREVGMMPVLHKWAKSRFNNDTTDIFVSNRAGNKLYLMSRRSPVHSEKICEAYNTVNIEGNHYYRKLAIYELDQNKVYYCLKREGELVHD